MSRRLFWISLNYATFGIESDNNTVVHAAPIARWMVGKTLSEIKPWLIKRGAKVVEVCDKHE